MCSKHMLVQNYAANSTKIRNNQRTSLNTTSVNTKTEELVTQGRESDEVRGVETEGFDAGPSCSAPWRSQSRLKAESTRNEDRRVQQHG